MDESGALAILDDIQALVSDKLQVVSYKWLSRNFSVSSDDAKRFLQEFVERHGNEVEVIYILSGWLKKSPRVYHTTLVSKDKLTDVKTEFKDVCSVQVYSVQSCIPKDPAAIRNSEFMQAQELFNQPAAVDNCLRDNRFCGVKNSLVKRNINGNASSFTLPARSTVRATLTSKSSGVAQALPHPQPQLGRTQSSSVGTIDRKIIRPNTPGPHVDAAEPHIENGKGQTNVHNEKNGPNEKNIIAGGTLANLWGRASAKSKVSCPTEGAINGAAKAGDASSETQILVHEAIDSAVSDDEEEINCRRGSKSESSRKRRVVFDSSDEEDTDENVVSLSSPDPPKSTSLLNSKNLVLHKESLNVEKENEKEMKIDIKQEKTINIKQENTTPSASGVPPNDIPRFPCNVSASGTSMSEKIQSQASKGLCDQRSNDQAQNASTTSPKRKKILKTRIDERGREVTVVAWEGEVADTVEIDKTTAVNNAGKTANTNRPLANKAQPVVPPAPNPASRTGNKKTSKGGGKDAKQGNILSFFKKVS